MFYKDLYDSVILLFRIIKTPSHPNHKSKINFDTMFIALYVSCDTFHMSHVTFLVSGVTCHMSVVTCQESHVTFNSQTARARELIFLKEKVHIFPPFTCYMSHVMCHMSHVIFFFFLHVEPSRTYQSVLLCGNSKFAHSFGLSNATHFSLLDRREIVMDLFVRMDSGAN